MQITDILNFTML